VVPIAPSTYHRRRAQEREPTRRSARVQRDDTRRIELRREGIPMARCTVRRLMKELGLAGAVRGRAWVTTTDSSTDVVSPPDLVDRQFTATHPNQLWVADFT
jgi:transposase InsO family protein